MAPTPSSLDLPSIKKLTGASINQGTSLHLPKRITDLSHVSDMVAGHQRRMSGGKGGYSPLGPPKRPHVRKGKVS